MNLSKQDSKEGRKMERVLALQALSEHEDVDPVNGGSGESNGCSSESSGTGRSTCSIACGEAEEMDW
jgi:hypothetical protein